MQLYLGTDICEIERIEKLYTNYGEKFLNKTFSKDEIKYCLSNKKLTAQRLAVRFATKESVSKALKVGLNKLGWNKGINFKDVELIRDTNGAVVLKLSGIAADLETKFGITKWEVSVSHSQRDAMSTVIGYKD